MPNKEIPFFVTSDPLVNNVTQNGSFVSMFLNPPVKLDKNKKAYIALVDASIWFVSPNIGPEFSNNVFKWTNNNTAETYTYELPSGLYSISNISQTISEQVRNNGYNEGLFRFQIDESNAFLSIQVNMANVTIHWSEISSIGPIIGFITDDTVTVSGTFVESDQKVAINTLTEILIHCSLVTGVIYNNNSSSDIMHSIVPNVSPQSLINFEPKHLLFCPLTSNSFDKIKIYLTDQYNKPLNLVNEIFTATLLIRVED